MSTTAVTAAAASFREEQSTCSHVHTRVRVRGRGRNSVGTRGQEPSLIRNTFYRQQENYFYCVHLQVLRQGIFFFVGMFLRLIIYSMQGLNLEILIWQNSCSLRGVPCMVHPVQGREGWVMGTAWLWGLQKPLLASVTTELLSRGFYRSVELWGWHNTGEKWPKWVVWRRIFAIVLIKLAQFLTQLFDLTL